MLTAVSTLSVKYLPNLCATGFLEEALLVYSHCVMSSLCINAYSRNSTELLCQSTGFITCLSPVLMSSLCINAFIYAAKYREFQQGVRRLTAELAKRLNRQQTEVEISAEMGDTDESQRLQSFNVADASAAEPQAPGVDK